MTSANDRLVQSLGHIKRTKAHTVKAPQLNARDLLWISTALGLIMGSDDITTKGYTEYKSVALKVQAIRTEHEDNIMTPSTIITDYQDGLLTRSNAVSQLEGLQVRGSFRDDDSFIGYDYRNQEWVEVVAPG